MTTKSRKCLERDLAMKLLLDPHILYWFLNNDPALSKQAREMILNQENMKYFSVISVWETAIKHAKHPTQITSTGVEFIELCRGAGFLPLDVSDKYVAALETLRRAEDAPPHKDPFDRMLIAQAKSEGMLFLTHDAKLPYYQEDCIVPV